MKTLICDIKRFAVHDGDGIRTTLFLKGCPLKCVWCHNPESISVRPQLAYYGSKCIGCGECTEVCKSGAHKMTESGHIFDPYFCIACGKCEEVCLGSALTLYGKEVTVDEILPRLLEDKEFFETSGGGVTLSGGSALYIPIFVQSFLKSLKKTV